MEDVLERKEPPEGGEKSWKRDPEGMREKERIRYLEKRKNKGSAMEA